MILAGNIRLNVAGALAIVCAVPCIIVSSVSAQEFNPLAYWKFEEGSGQTASDARGGNDLNLISGAWIPGKVGTAIFFDSLDDCLQRECVTPQLGNLLTFSIEAWISDAGNNWYRGIFAKPAGTSCNGYEMGFGMQIKDSLIWVWSNMDAYWPWAHSVDLRVPRDTWTHVAVTCRYISYFQREFHIYINGMEAQVTQGLGLTMIPAARLYIGGGDPAGLNHSLFHGAIDEVAVFGSVLTPEEIAWHYRNSSQGRPYDQDNNPPVADAGDNMRIRSEEIASTAIIGAASDAEGDNLSYCWYESDRALMEFSPVVDGKCALELASADLGPGTHSLTLVVEDGKSRSSDQTLLTIDNSAPHIMVTGGGTYSLGSKISLGGQVSDFDGDPINYDWFLGDELLFSGAIQCPAGGAPVDLSRLDIEHLDLGEHMVTIRVYDPFNAPVIDQAKIAIIDDVAPSIAPIAQKTILWPPNHAMIDINIQANAHDNSGAVHLSATVSSNEAQDGIADGDLSPDWTQPVINEATGVITLKLRAERAGNRNGRIYSIAITAQDEAENSNSAVVTVLVPHDKGGDR
jgi:hypothetical protein